MSEVGTDGGVLRGHHDRRSLVAHLAHDLDQSATRSWLSMYLWGLVEDDELVEPPALVGGLGEQLQQHDEQPEGLVLLDELVPKIHDHEPAGPQDVGQALGIDDVVLRELQPQQGEVLQIVGEPGVVDAPDGERRG